MKPRTLQEEVTRIKNMMLQEGGWNLPDNVSDNDPHFNEPDPVELDTWEYNKDRTFTLYAYNGETASLSYEQLLGYNEKYDEQFPEEGDPEEEFKNEQAYLGINGNPDMHDIVTDIIEKLIDSGSVDWTPYEDDYDDEPEGLY